jgi:hypothetical protein
VQANALGAGGVLAGMAPLAGAAARGAALGAGGLPRGVLTFLPRQRA